MQAEADDEVDPLESFMAEMAQEVTHEKSAAPRPKPGLELDDDDNVADFLEVISSVVLVHYLKSTVCCCCTHTSARS